MPRLHVDRNERGSDVHQPGANHARALEVIEAVNRLALEVAEILRRDDQQPPEGGGPAPVAAPDPDPQTRSTIDGIPDDIGDLEETDSQEEDGPP